MKLEKKPSLPRNSSISSIATVIGTCFGIASGTERAVVIPPWIDGDVANCAND